MGRNFQVIDGYSYYAWVSLIVKSVRFGWPEGIRQAEARIGSFITKKTATVQIFEDILPAEKDVNEINRLIWAGDWDTVCSYNTHHGRGQTDWFIKMCESGYSDYAGKHETEVRRLAEEKYGFKKIQARMCGDFWTWYHIKGKITETGYREIDKTPWNGIPASILDMHTAEGKRMKTNVTLLSGTEAGHIKFAKMVKYKGWDEVRRIIHSDKIYPVTSLTPYQPKVQEKQDITQASATTKPKSKYTQMSLAVW